MKAIHRLYQFKSHFHTQFRLPKAVSQHSKMSTTQYKSHIGWFHETTSSAAATDRVIDLARDIVRYQSKQDGCAFDVVLASREDGQETRLEMIMK